MTEKKGHESTSFGMLVLKEWNYKMAAPVALCDILFSHYIPNTVTEGKNLKLSGVWDFWDRAR